MANETKLSKDEVRGLLFRAHALRASDSFATAGADFQAFCRIQSRLAQAAPILDDAHNPWKRQAQVEEMFVATATFDVTEPLVDLFISLLTADALDAQRTNGVLLNVNMQATVTLTNAGRRRLIEFITDLTIPKPEEHCDVCYKGWRDGKMNAQLWDLMHIFGKMMYNGSPALPFERNEVEIPASEFEWRAAADKRAATASFARTADSPGTIPEGEKSANQKGS